MKKLALTFAIILGITLGAYAQYGGGLFQRGAVSDEEYYGAGYFTYNDRISDPNPLIPILPFHGETDNQEAPVGSGMLLLIGFGAAYALKKKREE